MDSLEDIFYMYVFLLTTPIAIENGDWSLPENPHIGTHVLKKPHVKMQNLETETRI